MAKSTIPLTAARLREVLHYDPETGEFRWLDTRWRKRGPVGSIQRVHDKYARRIITIDYGTYKAHRLAWLYMTGEFPSGKIDHRNQHPLDNRWANLRIATDVVNSRNRGLSKNNTSGAQGVCWSKITKSWKVYLGRKWIGHYKDKTEAMRIAAELRKDWCI